jgi:tryptophan-rich sensory protein
MFGNYDVKLSDIILLLFPLVVGIILVSIFVRKESICGKHPKLQPPGWVFATVWPILYILMGISIFIYWRKSERKLTYPFYLFIIGTLLLQVWWITFNKICKPIWAFVSLVCITIYFCGTAISFYKVSQKSTFYLIPLLCWLSFASYLSYSTI